MRLWSIHPEYLDSRGLVALWREALLAKKVLENKTKGYTNHPQLIRFKNTEDPLICINHYLYSVFQEAVKRDFVFDKTKIGARKRSLKKISVTKGQLDYEFKHLLKKLKKRDPQKYKSVVRTDTVSLRTNPVFKTVAGKIEDWEINPIV